MKNNLTERRPVLQISLTAKLGIKFKSRLDAQAMTQTLDDYRQACQYVSDYVFDHDFPMNTVELNKILYQDLRANFNLKSQMAQSTLKTVVARYKTTQSQLKKQKVWDGYKKDNHGKEVPNYVSKDLYFLQKPIQFKRPQVDLVRNRDYSFKENNQLSINSSKGRLLVDVYTKGFEHYLDGSWKLGTGKIVKSGNKWYFHLAVTKEFPDFELNKLKHVVGIDRGLRQLMTTYDESGKTAFYSGKAISKKRRKYAKLRQSLQAKNTKSAKRRLRQIGNRESRWMSDVNHCLSKTLVSKYGSSTLFVLEDLTNVTFDTVNNRKKEDRYEHHSWAFYDLEQKLAYKASLIGSEVITVSAQYTSQRCPKCGTIAKDNRDRTTHSYTCSSCSYSSNDDRIAAMNIQELGKWYVSGVSKPKFEHKNLDA